MGINNNNMKYLVFRDTSTATFSYPFSSLKLIRTSIDTSGDIQSNGIDLFFQGGDVEKDQIKLNIKASATVNQVIKDLLKAITEAKTDIIRVVDDISKQYILSSISSMEIISN